jgi:hypothetical protein
MTGSPLSADSGGTPATVGGGITRLNPSDGLFLRAQHLTVMEDYALALAQSAAQAAGTGVVYGYRAWIDGATLKVDPGLAIGPDGRPLRCTQIAELDLSALTVDADGFFVLEVSAASWDYGQENVYSNLCDDPCSGAAAIHPYQAEGITIDLRADSLPGLSAQTDGRKRNWLASRYYERERERGGPWLVPGTPGSAVADLVTIDFAVDTAAPEGNAVPLAVLLNVGGSWLVDLWIARRDLGDPAPRRAWQSRLAMRPWDVFIAQVLQFQAQLTDFYTASQAGPAKSAAAAELAQTIDSIREQFGNMRVKPHWLGDSIADLERALPQLDKAARRARDPSTYGLRELGFGELPPAGYLPSPPPKQGARAYAEQLFGPYVKVRICCCRADHAVRAVEQAQHLDRIPLDQDAQKGTPSVDVLVPEELADLASLYTASYPWLAFVRRSERTCPSERPVDRVAVYLIDARDDADAMARQITGDLKDKGALPDTEPFGWLTYPAGTYAVPTPGDVYDILHQHVDGKENLQLISIGLASAEDRQPLAAVRTALLALEVTSDSTLRENDIRAAFHDGLSPEAIVIVFGINADHTAS